MGANAVVVCDSEVLQPQLNGLISNGHSREAAITPEAVAMKIQLMRTAT